MRPQILLALALLLLLGTFRTEAQYEVRYYLPHIVNGRFAENIYKTTFIFFNNTDRNVALRLEMTGNEGQPLALTLPGLGTGSNFPISLEPGGSRFYQTDGSGNLAAGAATVRADSNIGVSAIFSIYDANGIFMTEAGVGGSEPQTDFVIPVDVTGDFNTGLAIFNPGIGNASVNLSLLEEGGKETAKTVIGIGSGAHRALFVAGPGQLFPAVSNFRGILSVQSDAPLAAVTLRQNGAPLSYTSLPVVKRGTYPEGAGLAHVANGIFEGGSFRTSFLIFNVSPVSTTLTLALTKSDGSPFPVTFAGKGTGSSFDFKLEPNASVFLQTDGSGPLTTGGATITSPQLVGASAIFSVFDSRGRFQTEAGVGAERPKSQFTLPVDISRNSETGVAFFNLSQYQADLILRLLRSDGEMQGDSITIRLPSMNHTARFVSQLFPGLTEFRGSLAVACQTGIAALTLRQISVPLSYTTLPVQEGISRGRILPLLPKTRANITATADVVINESLSTGYRLSGAIRGPGYPGLAAAQSSTGEFYYGQPGGQLGSAKYLIVLPPGTYRLKICYSALVSPANITYTDPNPIQIAADTTRDITLPSVSLTNVSGTVSGFGSLPTASQRFIVLNSTDNTVWVQTVVEDSGRYVCQLPPGNYRANLYMPGVQFPGGQGGQHLTLFNFGAVTVGSSPLTANFTLPAVSKLTGTLAQGSIRAEDRSAPQQVELACGYFPAYSYTGSDPSGQYQMWLGRDRSYDVHGEIPVLAGPVSPGQEPTYAGTLRFPFPAAIVNMTSDSRLDFTVPRLPGTVTISGRITDSSGRGLGGVEVGALSQSITGIPSAQLSNLQMTDANGRYSIVVLNGTNYKLTFTPLVPAP